MLTPFGEAFRAIRKKRGLFLKDIEAKLGKPASFISAIDHGKKNIPDGYVDEICDALRLNKEERRLLCAAECQVKNRVVIHNYRDLSTDQQHIAHSLAQELRHLSKLRMQKILALLRSDDDEPDRTVIPRTLPDD